MSLNLLLLLEEDFALEDAHGPDACPECGCEPGDGYTPGCPGCADTLATLWGEFNEVGYN